MRNRPLPCHRDRCLLGVREVCVYMRDECRGGGDGWREACLRCAVHLSRLRVSQALLPPTSRRGVRPNVTTFNTLIAAASDAGNYTVLHEVAEWMDTSADADIRAPCLNALVLGLVKVGWAGLGWVGLGSAGLAGLVGRIGWLV